MMVLFVLALVALEIGANPLEHAGRVPKRNMALQRRYSNARFTFFDTGLGACGTTNSPSDFIVALNSEQYGDGEHCYEMIEITYQGKTAQAQIVDECPGCPFAGLDFSTGLFDHFASEDLGVLYGSWNFAGTSSTTKQVQSTTKTSMAVTTSTTQTSSTAMNASSATPSTPSATEGGLEQLSEVLRSLVGLVAVGASL